MRELPQEVKVYDSEPLSPEKNSAVDLWCTACAVWFTRWAYLSEAQIYDQAILHVQGKPHQESVIKLDPDYGNLYGNF